MTRMGVKILAALIFINTIALTAFSVILWRATSASKSVQDRKLGTDLEGKGSVFRRALPQDRDFIAKARKESCEFLFPTEEVSLDPIPEAEPVTVVRKSGSSGGSARRG